MIVLNLMIGTIALLEFSTMFHNFIFCKKSKKIKINIIRNNIKKSITTKINYLTISLVLYYICKYNGYSSTLHYSIHENTILIVNKKNLQNTWKSYNDDLT